MSESEARTETRLVAGRYKLLNELGRGGMGTVWLADDTLTGRRVAVKELRPRQGSSDEDRQEHLKRSLQEARSAARISHPNAVTLYDVIPASTNDEAIYLIMELVEGPTLNDLVYDRGGTLPAPLVARFGLQLLDVLEAAHGLGIVHRDIKPGNVLIARGDQAKLTDFGIAHLVGGTRLTRAGTAGTLCFMAPELFEGASISAANDVWALGATLFYAADGRVPFEREFDAATMRAILDEDLPVPGCDPDLAEVISGMLRRDQDQRLTVAQARDALRPVATQEAARKAAQGAETGDPAAMSPLAGLAGLRVPPARPVPPESGSPAAPGGQADAPTGMAPPAPAAPPQAPSTGAPTGTPAAGSATSAAPRRPGPVQWNDNAATGMWKGTPTGIAKPQAPPAPAPRKPRFSRKTLILAAAAAGVFLLAAGTVSAVLATGSAPSPLTLRATMTNPGSNPVTDVVFSPDDGTKLATTDSSRSASGQNAAVLWDTASDTAISKFNYEGLGNSLALSPDGTKLAIASTDLYVYRVADQASLVYQPTISPEAVAFTPDGSSLAVGGHWSATNTENVGLVNPTTRQQTATMPGLNADSFIGGVAFSPDGSNLAATDSVNNLLYVWNAGSRKLLTTPVPLNLSTGPLAFSPDGKTIAVSAGGPGEVRLWSATSKTWTTTLNDPQGKRVNSIAYSLDGKTLAVADGNGTVDLWNTATDQLIAAQKVNAKGVDSVAFSPDGKTLATGDAAGQLKLWTVAGN